MQYDENMRRMTKIREIEDSDNRLGHLDARSARQLFYAHAVREAYIECGGDDAGILHQRGAAWWIEQQTDLLGGPIGARKIGAHGPRPNREREMLDILGDRSMTIAELCAEMTTSYETVVRLVRVLSIKALVKKTNTRPLFVSRVNPPAAAPKTEQVDSSFLRLVGAE